MSFSGPLKYSCEAAVSPEKWNTVGWGFKTSCRNVLPCKSICNVEKGKEEKQLCRKK